DADMALWSFVTQRRSHARLHHLAGRIAAASLPDVVARLRQDVARMSAAEAWGYVRARSATIVIARADAMTADTSESLSRTQHERLVATCLDIVARHAIDHARRSVPLRRGARMAA